MKILIADDARDVAEVVAFGARMTWPGCEVALAADGTEALEQFAAASPDLVVLDVTMPPPDGFAVCRMIRTTSRVPILMPTVCDSILDKVRAFDGGADDYLTKPFDHLELLARLRALVRRATPPPAPVPARPGCAVGDLTIDFASHVVCVAGTPLNLTSTEYRLLEELVRHPGMVLTHHMLLEQVWGPEYCHEVQYLKVFVRRLRRKLGDTAAQPRYIQTEWGLGYRFVPAD
ncbi:MAG: response regulator transcription factor [Chloroflexota bacterium]|nr:response regulator transcription factor [Chloroflexota bacterium]